MKSGILVINKSDGMTSHDVVQKVRHRFKMRRVGHAGTLDPLATGVLVVLLGESTKLFNQFVKFDKIYRATLILGLSTTSADIEGKILKRAPYEHITRQQIETIFNKFSGEIEQIPPMVSAVKVGGRKLYQLARQGIEVERKARKIRIDCLKLEQMALPEVKFYIECSKGTYVRQLAEDIGVLLGCGACISQIERVAVGSFHIDESIKLKDLDESHIRNWTRSKSN